MKSLVAVSGLLLVAACAYPSRWDREEMIIPGKLPVEQQVKIWRGRTLERWHAVVYTRDSVSGIPYLMPATCDSCRLAIAQQGIDSITVGYPVSREEADKQNAWYALLVVILALTP